MKRMVYFFIALMCATQAVAAVEPAMLEASKKAFYQLTLTKDDVKNIHYIVKSMGTCSYGTLLVRSVEMNKRGDAIRHVHPLRFLGCIVSNSKQKEYLKEIRRSKVKWMTFRKNLFGNLKREKERG